MYALWHEQGQLCLYVLPSCCPECPCAALSDAVIVSRHVVNTDLHLVMTHCNCIPASKMVRSYQASLHCLWGGGGERERDENVSIKIGSERRRWKYLVIVWAVMEKDLEHARCDYVGRF